MGEVVARRLLRELDRIRATFGADLAARKRALLRALRSASLPAARDVLRYHEALCFLSAYPDDRGVDAEVRRQLARFERRADLRRHAETLASSGIAGTPTDYWFFYPMARWLATHWPSRLTMRWKDFEHPDRLELLLPLLGHPGEQPALDELDFGLEGWIERLKHPRETDAAFLVRRFSELAISESAREAIYDSFDAKMRLEPGPGTPTRTTARVRDAFLRRTPSRGRVHYQAAPLVRGRPDLAAELPREPRAVRSLGPREGRELLDLARLSMVTRKRDLDAFSWGDPRDVRLVDYGDGLQFAAIGVLPERRLLLEAVYGYLTLKNGVPIGYVLTSALFGSSEVAYNVFETWRGTEAGLVYGRVLAMTRHLFGSTVFTIDPFQLGHDNDEAIESGAWWFYYKAGFRPRDPQVRRVLRRELARMRRNPAHRSSPTTLRALATENLYYQPAGRSRDDVLGLLPLPNAGFAVTRMLARRFGSARERAAQVCAEEAADRLRVRSFRGWNAEEREAWVRWAPLVTILPGLSRWSPAERRALVAVVRAKGGRRESDFVHRFDAHAKLRAAVRRLAVSTRVE